MAIQKKIQQSSSLSSEEIAFCALLARIMRRCIAERDERIMRLIENSTLIQCTESEGAYDSAA